jgi:hypothetical protein
MTRWLCAMGPAGLALAVALQFYGMRLAHRTHQSWHLPMMLSSIWLHNMCALVPQGRWLTCWSASGLAVDCAINRCKLQLAMIAACCDFSSR